VRGLSIANQNVTAPVIAQPIVAAPVIYPSMDRYPCNVKHLLCTEYCVLGSVLV